MYAEYILHRAAACLGYEDLAWAVAVGLDRFMSHGKDDDGKDDDAV